MITGFEEETGTLTNEEMSMAQLFVKGFSTKIGEANAVKSSEIIAKLKVKGFTLTGARLRKIVNFIRINGWIKNLVATSKGYYIEPDPEKVQEYKQSLKQRAAAIIAVADSYN